MMKFEVKYEENMINFDYYMTIKQILLSLSISSKPKHKLNCSSTVRILHIALRTSYFAHRIRIRTRIRIRIRTYS